MLVLPDIYVLKTESIQKKTFLEDNLNKKLDEKNINNENFDKNFLIKIDDLDLPVRVLNFLKTENINYVGELIQYTEKDILSFPNSGRKSLQEIKYELSQINLTLGTKLDKQTDLYQNINEVAEYKIKHKLKEEQLKILITEIRNTNLSQRSINGLLNIGCVQAADILKFQISDLKRMPNLGASSIKEIELFLKDMNLEFNDELAPWNEEIIQEKYRGIRPAPGYPACPDHQEKIGLFDLLNATELTGVSLTESLAMLPTASVSGWYFAHPDAKYFGLGKITPEQIEDVANRKGVSVSEIERWYSSILL